MNKTFKIYGILFIIIAILLALLELNKKEVLDWRKNFDTTKKTPFGLYIFNNEIDHLLKNKVKRIKESPYGYFETKKQYEPQNILIIKKEIDNTSWEKIIQQVEQGSDVIYINNQIDIPEDHLEMSKHYYNIYSDTITLKFTDKKLYADSIILDKLPSNRGLGKLYDKEEILGYSTSKEEDKLATFIKIKKGKGNIFLHIEPLFLTNYYLLKPKTKKYVEGVFSHFQDRETIWFVEDSTHTVSLSPLRVILANPSLKYAWWLLLTGLLLFLFFNAKRKQRIIPVIEPARNKSVEFIRSVGNLYLQEGDFHNMMAKKAQYFLHKVRTDLMIDTQILDENFSHKLHIKTGKPLSKIQEAIILIKKGTDIYAQVTKEDLIKMNTLLDEILK